MTNPKGITPNWDHRTDRGIVKFASAQVDLPHPIALPPETPTCLFLNIYREDDGYRWSCYYKVPVEVNEGEVAWGSSIDQEGAKQDCWSRAIDFLHDVGYSSEAIVVSVISGGAE